VIVFVVVLVTFGIADAFLQSELSLIPALVALVLSIVVWRRRPGAGLTGISASDDARSRGASQVIQTLAPQVAQTPAARKETLDRALQDWAAKGWRIETRSDHQAMVARGKEISHLLHLVLTLITLGVWVIVWLLVAAFGGVKRRLLTVDEYGYVVEQKV
jgi:hypothetical protein